MHLAPEHQQHVADQLRAANASKQRIESVDLSRLNRVVEYAPEDMTATVEAGLSLAEFQSVVHRHGQWLPLDPSFTDNTIAEILDRNLSGPRRLGYGTIRDYLIGIKVALASGEIIKAGGKVVKNVAGYDLCKLFVGGRQTLGIILEATFKLRPLPEKETILKRTPVALEQIPAIWNSIQDNRVYPVVFDLYRERSSDSITCVVALAGSTEDVQAQEESAREAGFIEPATLGYDKTFWTEFPAARTISVAPSQVLNLVKQVEGPFVCRLSNGVLYHASKLDRANAATPSRLMEKVKSVFDPNGIFPEFQP